VVHNKRKNLDLVIGCQRNILSKYFGSFWHLVMNLGRVPTKGTDYNSQLLGSAYGPGWVITVAPDCLVRIMWCLQKILTTHECYATVSPWLAIEESRSISEKDNTDGIGLCNPIKLLYAWQLQHGQMV